MRVPCASGKASSTPRLSTSGRFFLVSMRSWTKFAGCRFDVRLHTRTGLPVVSCPYIAAAEMPMPC